MLLFFENREIHLFFIFSRIGGKIVCFFDHILDAFIIASKIILRLKMIVSFFITKLLVSFS